MICFSFRCSDVKKMAVELAIFHLFCFKVRQYMHRPGAEVAIMVAAWQYKNRTWVLEEPF
jgi:hypothetical protein